MRQQQNKAMEAKGKAGPNEPQAKSAWSSAHPKFVMGKPMMTTEDLDAAGVNTRELHKHYIQGGGPA